MRFNSSDLVTTPLGHAAGLIGGGMLRGYALQWGQLASAAVGLGVGYFATQHGGGFTRRLGQGVLAGLAADAIQRFFPNLTTTPLTHLAGPMPAGTV